VAGLGLPNPVTTGNWYIPQALRWRKETVSEFIYIMSGGGIGDTWAISNNTPTANHSNNNADLGQHHHTLSLKYHITQILNDDLTINENGSLSFVRIIIYTLNTVSSSATAISASATLNGVHRVSSIVFYLKLII